MTETLFCKHEKEFIKKAGLSKEVNGEGITETHLNVGNSRLVQVRGEGDFLIEPDSEAHNGWVYYDIFDDT